MEKLLITSSLRRWVVALKVAHKQYVDLGSDVIHQVDRGSVPTSGLHLD